MANDIPAIVLNIPLTKLEFEFLQDNVTQQFQAANNVSYIALSGLQYVVDLQVAAPEIDLVVPFNQQVGVTAGFGAFNNYIPVAAAMCFHAATRGGTGTGSLSDRLNTYLVANEVCVTVDFSSLAAAAGYSIDLDNVENQFGCYPAIVTISPIQGTGGSEVITLTGTSFTGTTAVNFHWSDTSTNPAIQRTAPALVFSVSDDTDMTVTAPAGSPVIPAGTITTVKVVNARGEEKNGVAFKYV